MTIPTEQLKTPNRSADSTDALSRETRVILGASTFDPEYADGARNAVNVCPVSYTHQMCIRDRPKKYDVIVDRISQDIPFYRAYLKNAELHGTIVVNNPFWWTADDKFFNYALAHKLGVAIPPTVILPHNKHPEGTTDRSMRNLIYPLNWQEVFDYVGFPAFLKPYSGGGWKHVYQVHSPEEFFQHYNQTGDLCMTLQHGVVFEEYYRCYVVGQEKVHIMKYDPRLPDVYKRQVQNRGTL